MMGVMIMDEISLGGDGVMRELIPTRILIERERILTIRIGIVDIFR